MTFMQIKIIRFSFYFTAKTRISTYLTTTITDNTIGIFVTRRLTKTNGHPHPRTICTLSIIIFITHLLSYLLPLPMSDFNSWDIHAGEFTCPANIDRLSPAMLSPRKGIVAVVMKNNSTPSDQTSTGRPT